MSKDLSHLGGSGLHGDPYTFCPDLWSVIVAKYSIKSVIDVGCAIGVNTKWFLDQGLRVLGVEGFPEYVANSRLPRECIVLHDYATGPYVPPDEFDLCLSIEFVEHVEERFIPNFMDTFKKCRFVLMSFATPGQGGFHHVAEREEIFWVKKMEEAGFSMQKVDTEWMRKTGHWTPYGRRTMTLFRRE